VALLGAVVWCGCVWLVCASLAPMPPNVAGCNAGLHTDPDQAPCAIHSSPQLASFQGGVGGKTSPNAVCTLHPLLPTICLRTTIPVSNTAGVLPRRRGWQDEPQRRGHSAAA